MLYKDLIEFYEKLDQTTKRLEKTYIIVELLKKAPKDLIKEIIYLLQGKVFPPWDERKIGMSSMLIIKVIRSVTGTSENEIKKLWRKTGDLGEVARELIKTNKQTKLSSKKLTIQKVVQNIRKLPELTGEGTVNRKVGMVSELLSNASPLEAKYVVKTILEELRIGIAEGTMRDAVVWAFYPKVIGIFFKCEKCKKINPATEKCLNCEEEINTKFKNEIQKHFSNCLEVKSLDDLKHLDKYDFVKAKEEKLAREVYNKFLNDVQHAYNLSNDLGVVAENLKLHGINSVTKVGMEVGTPVNVMLAIKLESIADALKALGKPVLADYKLDGFRCIIGHTPIYCLNKGYISVKDLKKGDRVLTHKGNFKRIIGFNKRIIDKGEKLFELQSFFGGKIRISEGHKILVARRNKEKWIPIEDVNKEDFLIFPIPKIKEKSKLKNYLALSDDSGYAKKIKVDSFFFRFLGFWIGDGFTNNYHNMERVGLLFNRKKEDELCNYYLKNIKEKFGIKNVTKSIQKNLINLYFRNKPFRIWLSQHFREEWKGKKVPQWFLGVNEKQFNSFIEGYLESDGHVDSYGRASITTKERDLAMFIQLLALKFKKVYGVYKLQINGRTYYRIMIPKRNRYYYKIVGDKVYIKILKLNELKQRDPKKKLYNLEVEEDESYCTSLISLHNCQVHKKGDKITLFTRRLENVTKQFPEVVDLVKKHVKGKSFILDSELVGYDPKTKRCKPFQEISQRIRRKYGIEKMAKELPVEMNIFDILYYEGKNMMAEPQSERRKFLEKIVKPLKQKIVLTKKIISDDVKELAKFYNQALKAGVEGLILKNMKKGYTPGRKVGGWVKIKPTLEPLDLVIIGATYGEGKRAHAFSSFILACRSGKKFLRCGMVGTGIKEKESEKGVTFSQLTKLLKPHILKEKGRRADIEPVIVVEVGYEEIQKSPTYDSGYALRFPRVLRLRTEDKKASQANTLADVEHIYKEQKKLKSKKESFINKHYLLLHSIKSDIHFK